MRAEYKLFYTILALIISLMAGKFLIPVLTRLKIGQSIRDDGPQSHMVKSGTPTIGGLIFISSFLLVNIISRNINLDIGVIIISTLLFGLTGFFDDYIKVVNKRNLGFTALQKLICQIIGACIVIIYLYFKDDLSTSIIVPFIKRSVDMGIFYIPFILFVVVGTVNAVNLTDGLDGLASGTSIITFIFFAICSKKLGQTNIELFCLIMVGAILGFLYFNKYPARVFMGDTGSLTLGGAVSAVAVLLKMPLILPICCGIFFIEALSVIIQVTSFKLRGKRVFLMSPLHHHFEQKGWKETKIVFVFCTVQVILCIISYFIIF